MKHTHLLGWVVAMTSFTLALAAELPDPTRPPPGVAQQAQSAGRVPSPYTSGDAPATPQGPATDRAKAASAAARPARLSAIMLADLPGRDAAVIDGDVRHVGDKVRGATVSAIHAAGVTLRDARGRSVRLSLFERAPEPDARLDAQPSSPRPAASASSVADAAALSLTTPSGALAPGKEQP
jgi:hypothetical protein